MFSRKQLWRRCKSNIIYEKYDKNLKTDLIPTKYKENKKSVKFNNIVDVILIPINKYHSI